MKESKGGECSEIGKGRWFAMAAPAMVLSESVRCGRGGGSMLCSHEAFDGAAFVENVRGRARDGGVRSPPKRGSRSLPETHFAPPTQRLIIAAVERTHE